MSLINQALRKAQRDRTPNRMAQPGASTPPSGTAAATENGSGNGMKPILVIGLITVVALLIGVVAGLSVVLFKDSPAPAQQAIEPAASLPIAQAPIAPTPQPLSQPNTAQASAQPAEKEPPAPNVIEELRLARQAAEIKAQEDALAAQQAELARIAAEEEAARKAAAKPSQDIIDWLSKAQITGVRLSETGSKVILNGKAYAVNETVHYGLDLKVLLAEEKRVLFIDANGKKYMKRL